MLYGPVRAPEGVGLGKAKVVVSFPDWKEGKVAPASYDIPVLERAPVTQGKDQR